MELVTPPDDVRTYDRERALWIAEQYAGGDCTLKQLHEENPARVPAPFWLYRWRRDFPDFDMLMQDAERVRAAVLADDVLAVADAAGAAAHNRNRMKARQWLAEKGDRERYGAGMNVKHDHSGSVTVNRVDLTDEQLAHIIAGDRPVIEGEATSTREALAHDAHARPGARAHARDAREAATPTPPAGGEAPADFLIPSDSSPLTTDSEKNTQTGNGDIDD